MSSVTQPRVQARWQAQHDAADAFLRAQKPAKPATTLEGIQARIGRAPCRAEALRRSLLADGAQWLSNRETLLSELSRLEKELEGLYAQKRGVRAADGMGCWW